MKKFFSKLLANTRDRRKRGFTLIELLIVIGILGILVVAVLLTLNPAEAQRKTRDTKRMKDLTTMQLAISQYLDNKAPPAVALSVTSVAATLACATNWTTLDLCPYMQTVPIDPLNNALTQVAGIAAAGACPTTQSAQTSYYRLHISTSGDYEVNVRQESATNCNNLTRDGGNSNFWVEQGSNLTLLAE